MSLKNYYLYAALAFAVLLSPGLASASEESRKEASEVAIDEVVVTADKREQKAKDIPTSMSVLSGIQLEDRGINDVQELVQFTPNVHMKSGSTARALIFRGISNDADFIHSPVGVFIDDIGFSMNFMQNPVLYDIERIEVLRGPQGTLYGRNSESGVINIITRQPDNDFRGTIYTDIGAYQPDHGTSMSYKTGFSVSGPVVRDKLFLGLAGEYEKSDGYIEDSYQDDDSANDIDHRNIRLVTRWTPTSKLEITANADILEMRDGNAVKRYLEGPYATSPHEVRYDHTKNENRQDGDGQSLKVKYETNNFDVVSITGRRFHKNQMYRDGGGTIFSDGLNDIYYLSDALSQELRFSSNKETRFKWVGGVYAFKENYDTYVDLPTLSEVRDTEVDSEGYAVFGQGTYSLTKRLHLTAGLRYGYDKQDGSLEYDGVMGQFKLDKEFDDDVLLPKLSVSFDVTPKVMTYATVSKGYYGGGYNTAYAMSEDGFAYGPEYTWNYEAGIKSSLFNDRLNLNIAAFYIDIEDKQVAQLDGLTDMMVVENAAEAHSQGFEFELHAKPAAGFDLFGGVGYTEVVFDDWTAREMVRGNGSVSYIDYDYSDKDMPNAPKLTYNIGAQYRHKSGLFGRVDMNSSGDYYSDAKNTQKIEGVELVNLRLGYETERYDIILWAKNITNEEYITMGFARKFDQAVDGEPRMIGTTLRWRF